jgi:hypothetical protein
MASLKSKLRALFFLLLNHSGQYSYTHLCKQIRHSYAAGRARGLENLSKFPINLIGQGQRPRQAFRYVAEVERNLGSIPVGNLVGEASIRPSGFPAGLSMDQTEAMPGGWQSRLSTSMDHRLSI